MISEPSGIEPALQRIRRACPLAPPRCRPEPSARPGITRLARSPCCSTAVIDAEEETPMRWHKNFPIAAVVALAAAVATAGAFGHPVSKKNDGVKGKIHKGTLTVTGTKGDDTLTLALRAGDPNTLVVSTGSYDLTFDRSQFDAIVVNAGRGNDTVSIDERNGAFTDTETTTLNGEEGDDT